MKSIKYLLVVCVIACLLLPLSVQWVVPNGQGIIAITMLFIGFMIFGLLALVLVAIDLADDTDGLDGELAEQAMEMELDLIAASERLAAKDSRIAMLCIALMGARRDFIRLGNAPAAILIEKLLDVPDDLAELREHIKQARREAFIEVAEMSSNSTEREFWINHAEIMA